MALVQALGTTLQLTTSAAEGPIDMKIHRPIGATRPTLVALSRLSVSISGVGKGSKRTLTLLLLQSSHPLRDLRCDFLELRSTSANAAPSGLCDTDIRRCICGRSVFVSAILRLSIRTQSVVFFITDQDTRGRYLAQNKIIERATARSAAWTHWPVLYLAEIAQKAAGV